MTVRTLEDGAQRSLEDGTARLLESGGSTFDPLLDRALPFDGQKVYQRDWRAMAAPELLDGPLRGEAGELAVSASAVAFGVDVASGEAVIGGLHVENDTVRTLACAPAEPIPTNDLSPTLLDRIDLAVAGLDLATRVAYVDLKTGTPAVSPAAPAPTDDSFHLEIPLAEVLVAAGATELTDSDITDLRMMAVPTNGAGGLIGRLSVAADITTTDDEIEQLLDTWELVVALRAGRLYRIGMVGEVLLANATGKLYNLRVREDSLTGTLLIGGQQAGSTTQATSDLRFGLFDSLPPGSHTLVVTLQPDTGGLATEVTVFGAEQAAADNGNRRPWLLVYDDGPVYP